MSTEAPFLNETTTTELITHSSKEPSYNIITTVCGPLNASISEEIAANDLTSRANYCYVLCAVLGFASALFLFYSFFRTYRAGTWNRLDTLLCALSISEFYIVLCSLSSLAHRPQYLQTTNLNCAIFSFFYNVAYFSGQLMLVLMGFVLIFDQDPPSTPLLQTALNKPIVCVGVTTLASLLSSVLLMGLLGISRDPNNVYNIYKVTACRVDPCQASYIYSRTKLVLGFILPNLLLLALLGAGYLVWRRSNSSFLSRLKAFPVFLAVALVTFVCRIVYNGVLMKEVSLRVTDELSPRQEALMSVAEFVLFSGSCASLVLLLLLHGPFRDGLREVLCCHGMGGREANRHIMAPHIEIRDTQDMTTADDQETTTTNDH
ncbi:hypothetical protein MATL_G00010130 [Megalops atlanticus]|uniref:G-protein coupled receptors family 1 profile domain-containing protein n=1 Tax=Megalops atlanticus TaxID=7932 RepID=A0A9D3QJF3_MEGAT|nr:hypothetical protein MATL_G00010130 [Megalops atlanticus]